MTNVAGHLREQNGMYQMILSWKDTDGKRRTKSISTGPVSYTHLVRGQFPKRHLPQGETSDLRDLEN